MSPTEKLQLILKNNFSESEYLLIQPETEDVSLVAAKVTTSTDGMRMRVGFPVSEPFDNGSLVRCLELGYLTAAHTKHIGT